MQISENFTADVGAELAKLPEWAARIFVLRAIEDCSFEEIADEMGCDVVSAEDVYRLACEALRQGLEAGQIG